MLSTNVQTWWVYCEEMETLLLPICADGSVVDTCTCMSEIFLSLWLFSSSYAVCSSIILDSRMEKHIKDLSITFVQNDEVFTYTRRTLIVANILQKIIKLSTHTDALGFTLFPSALSRDWSSDSRTCSCTIVSLNCWRSLWRSRKERAISSTLV